jgi:gliding motility-associated-like protein
MKMFQKIIAIIIVGVFLECGISGNLLKASVINNFDSVFFDLANPRLTGNIIDIPVYFKSSDSIISLDFSFKFNEQNIKFDSVVSYKNYLLPLASFSSTDRYLRFTSNSNTFRTYEKQVVLFYLRFHFVGEEACKKISANDFNSITTYLNGDACSYKLTPPAPFKVPNANFSSAKACVGVPTQFTDKTILTNAALASWKWSFGNGKTSTEQNPVTTYTASSAFTVTLTVQSNEGCRDTVIKNINTNPSPRTGFSYTTSCAAGNILFTNSSFISRGSIASYHWDFGDEASSTEKNSKHNYYSNGTYSVSLTAISDSGCYAGSSSPIDVNMLQAQFTPYNTCVGQTVSFTDNSTSASVVYPVSSWKWYLGDGNTSTLQNPSNSYQISGTYIISLKVNDGMCNDSTTKVIRIEEAPVVDFAESTTMGCMPLTVSFIDSSIVNTESIYLWDFGDGNTSSDTSPSHTFVVNGDYTIKLRVETLGGCKDSAIKTNLVNVYGSPVKFSASSNKVKLNNAKIEFSNLINGYPLWYWSFNDSSYTSLFSPIHTFADTGKYRVCLTGRDFQGCSSTYCDTIAVLPANVIVVPQAFTPNGDNINDILYVRGGPLNEMKWSIYNEWGNQIFFSDSQNQGWDGTHKSTPQPAGKYKYVVQGKTDENENVSLHGVVVLIR